MKKSELIDNLMHVKWCLQDIGTHFFGENEQIRHARWILDRIIEDARQEDDKPEPKKCPAVKIKDGRCLCDVGTPCPLGKIASAQRCTKEELEAASIETIDADATPEKKSLGFLILDTNIRRIWDRIEALEKRLDALDGMLKRHWHAEGGAVYFYKP